MPEGDTLYKTAARLRPALEGGELVRFEAPRLKGSALDPVNGSTGFGLWANTC
ncbi:MAG: hypothetical protein IPN02_05865 [Candidatus Microthrix sp.]|uniref:Uncharacterized protein n=1 Tax=Candidatus Neomicrothrix subdominans TaxID=2954438 RepID=A0A936TE72_9ACTN|nr:hypothetical protein [Candidatus Microthrix subdominans]